MSLSFEARADIVARIAGSMDEKRLANVLAMCAEIDRLAAQCDEDWKADPDKAWSHFGATSYPLIDSLVRFEVPALVAALKRARQSQ